MWEAIESFVAVASAQAKKVKRKSLRHQSLPKTGKMDKFRSLKLEVCVHLLHQQAFLDVFLQLSPTCSWQNLEFFSEK